jgi:hypothetical protein
VSEPAANNTSNKGARMGNLLRNPQLWRQTPFPSLRFHGWRRGQLQAGLDLVENAPPHRFGSKVFCGEPELQSRCLILGKVSDARGNTVLRSIALFFSGALTLLIGFMGGA